MTAFGPCQLVSLVGIITWSLALTTTVLQSIYVISLHPSFRRNARLCPVGFEPTRFTTAGLESASLDHSDRLCQGSRLVGFLLRENSFWHLVFYNYTTALVFFSGNTLLSKSFDVYRVIRHRYLNKRQNVMTDTEDRMHRNGRWSPVTSFKHHLSFMTRQSFKYL